MTQLLDPAGRYAPPHTDVSDLVAPDAMLAARPRSVAWACALVLASIVIGLISLLPIVDPPMAGEPAAMTALIWGVTLVFTAVELWLVSCVWQRRNWARWLMVALTLIGIALALPVIGEDWTRSPLVAGLGIVEAVLSALAAVLLLTGPAARWFEAAAKNQSAGRSAAPTA